MDDLPHLILWVALGSAAGGVARFAVSGLVARGIGETFPWGTMVVNVTGAFAIGFLSVAALVTDLRRNPCQLGQTGHAVQTDAFALVEKIVVELAVPVNLTTFDPGLLQQLGLADVFLGALADRRLYPRIEAARLDAQTAAAERLYRALQPHRSP